LTFERIADAAQVMRGKNVRWKSSEGTIAGIYCGVPRDSGTNIFWTKLACDSDAKYNPETVAQLLMNGGFDTAGLISREVNGRHVDLVAVRPDYASVLLAGNQAAHNIAGIKYIPRYTQI
jgi:hypothetical protein